MDTQEGGNIEGRYNIDEANDRESIPVKPFSVYVFV